MASNNPSQSYTQGNTGRPPTTSVLRSAIYYQNRIIVQDKKDTKPDQSGAKSPTSSNVSGKNDRPNTSSMPNGPRAATSSGKSHTTSNTRPTSLGPISNTATSASRSRGGNDTVNTSVAANAVRGAKDRGCPDETVTSTRARSYNVSGVNRECGDFDDMDAHGIDIVVTDTEEDEKEQSILKRCYKCIQDNRMKGVPDAESILASSNPQDYKVLKKVLNITFLTVGIALLISVVISIIYSKIGEYRKT